MAAQSAFETPTLRLQLRKRISIQALAVRSSCHQVLTATMFRRGIQISHEGSDIPVFLCDGSILTVLISPSTTSASLAISLRQKLGLQHDGHFALCEAEGDLFQPIEETIVLARLLAKWPQNNLTDGPKRLVYKRTIYIPGSPAEKEELRASQKDGAHLLAFAETEHSWTRGKIRLSVQEVAQAAACLLLASRGDFDRSRDSPESIVPLVLDVVPLYALKAGTPGVPKAEGTGAIIFEGGSVNTTKNAKLAARQKEAAARNNGLGTAADAVSIEEIATMIQQAMAALAAAAATAAAGSVALFAEKAFIHICKRCFSYGYETLYGCRRVYKDIMLGQQPAEGTQRSRASSSVKMVNGVPVGRDGKPLSLQQQLEMSSLKEDCWVAIGHTGLVIMHSKDPQRMDSYGFDSVVKWVSSKDGKCFAFNSTVPATSCGPSPTPVNAAAAKGESVYLLCARANEEEVTSSSSGFLPTTSFSPFVACSTCACSGAIIERTVERLVEEAVRLKGDGGNGGGEASRWAPPRPLAGPGVTGVANVLGFTARRAPPYASIPTLDEQGEFLRALRTPPPSATEAEDGAIKKKSRKSIFSRGDSAPEKQPRAAEAPSNTHATEGAFARLKSSLAGKSGRGARAETSPAVITAGEESAAGGADGSHQQTAPPLSRGRSQTAVNGGESKSKRALSLFSSAFRGHSNDSKGTAEGDLAAAEGGGGSGSEGSATEAGAGAGMAGQAGRDDGGGGSGTSPSRRGTFGLHFSKSSRNNAKASSRSLSSASSGDGSEADAAILRQVGPAGGPVLFGGHCEKQAATSVFFRKPWQRRFVVIEGPAPASSSLAGSASTRDLSSSNPFSSCGAFSYWEDVRAYVGTSPVDGDKNRRTLLSLKDAEVLVPLESLQDEQAQGAEGVAPGGGDSGGQRYAFDIVFAPGAAMIGAFAHSSDNKSGSSVAVPGGRASTAPQQHVSLRTPSRKHFAAFLSALADAGAKISGPGAEKLVALLSESSGCGRGKLRRGNSKKRLSKASGGSSGKRSTGSSGKRSTGSGNGSLNGGEAGIATADDTGDRDGPQSGDADGRVRDVDENESEGSSDGDEEEGEEEGRDTIGSSYADVLPSTDFGSSNDNNNHNNNSNGSSSNASTSRLASSRNLLSRASSRRLLVSATTAEAEQAPEVLNAAAVAAQSISAAMKRSSVAPATSNHSFGAAAAAASAGSATASESTVGSSSVSVRDAAARFGSSAAAARPSSLASGSSSYRPSSYVPSGSSGDRGAPSWQKPGFSLRKTSSSSSRDGDGSSFTSSSGSQAGGGARTTLSQGPSQNGDGSFSPSSSSPRSPPRMSPGASSGQAPGHNETSGSFAFGLRDDTSSVADDSDREQESEQEADYQRQQYHHYEKQQQQQQGSARSEQEMSHDLHSQAAQGSSLPIGNFIVQGQLSGFQSSSSRSRSGSTAAESEAAAYQRGRRLSTAVYFSEEEQQGKNRGNPLNGLGGVDNNSLAQLYAAYGGGFGGYGKRGSNSGSSAANNDRAGRPADNDDDQQREGPPLLKTFGSGLEIQFETLPLRKPPAVGFHGRHHRHSLLLDDEQEDELAEEQEHQQQQQTLGFFFEPPSHIAAASTDSSSAFDHPISGPALPPTVAFAMQQQQRYQGGELDQFAAARERILRHRQQRSEREEQPFVVAAYGTHHPPPVDLLNHYRGPLMDFRVGGSSGGSHGGNSADRPAVRGALLPPSPPEALAQHPQRHRSPPRTFQPTQAGPQRLPVQFQHQNQHPSRQDLGMQLAPQREPMLSPVAAAAAGFGLAHGGGGGGSTDPISVPLPPLAGIPDVLPFVLSQNQAVHQHRMVQAGIALPPPPPSTFSDAAAPLRGSMSPPVPSAHQPQYYQHQHQQQQQPSPSVAHSLGAVLDAELPQYQAVRLSPQLMTSTAPVQPMRSLQEQFHSLLNQSVAPINARRVGIPSATPGRSHAAIRSPVVIPPQRQLRSPLAASLSLPPAAAKVSMKRSTSPARRKVVALTASSGKRR